VRGASADKQEPSVLADVLALKDPPEHTRLRSLLGPAFLPRVSSGSGRG